jgi:apolipoprotein D and lipocalin family protein
VVDKTTNAAWGMEFFWPFEAEYLITYLETDYSATIIARTKRDYAWIMARTPELPEERLQALESELARQGYDLSKLRRMPQRWPDAEHPNSPASGR